MLANPCRNSLSATKKQAGLMLSANSVIKNTDKAITQIITPNIENFTYAVRS